MLSAHALILAAALGSSTGPPPAASGPVAKYEFERLDRETMDAVARDFAISDRHGDTFTVYVPARRATQFHGLVPRARLIERDIDAVMRDVPRQEDGLYADYDEIQAIFSTYQAEHPDFVQVMDLPWMQTTNELPIVVLKLSGDVETDNPDKPGIVIASSVHGDEWIATAVVLGLIEQLIEGYGDDERFTRMIDWSSIYFIPVASPDSFHKSRETHGVDPNRVYPYPGFDDNPPIASARNIIKFYDKIQPAGSLDYHGIGGMVMFPWGYTCDPLADNTTLERFSDLAADMAAPNGYRHGDICNTIYKAAGGTVDAWYYLHDTLAMVIEIDASDKRPPASELPGAVADCSEPTWLFIENLLPDEDPNEDDGSNTGDSEDTSGTGSDTAGLDEEALGCGCGLPRAPIGAAAFPCVGVLAWTAVRRRRRERTTQ